VFLRQWEYLYLLKWEKLAKLLFGNEKNILKLQIGYTYIKYADIIANFDLYLKLTKIYYLTEKIR
jgi:hypothetical protein